MFTTAEEQDVKVRAAVYDAMMTTGVAPGIDALARELDLAPAAVRESLERLATSKALVLQRESRDVLMANPFSAVPTPFAVHANARLYYGNCIWDAFGIAAMLHTDVRIDSSCGCCGEAMQIEVGEGEVRLPATGVVNFAIPAKQWWQDIVYS